MNVRDYVEQRAAARMTEILASDCPQHVKYDDLDELQLWVMREHPDHWAAKVIQTISDAQTRVMYPEWKVSR